MTEVEALRAENTRLNDERVRLTLENIHLKDDVSRITGSARDLAQENESLQRENTRLSLEVDRLKRSRLRWRSVAYDKNAALAAAVALNTPLRSAATKAQEALRGAASTLDTEAEQYRDGSRYQPHGRYLRAQADAARQAAALLDSVPAVTGTRSDSAPNPGESVCPHGLPVHTCLDSKPRGD